MFENNDPRIFFAAERTALAWSRTTITLMALGFAIERFDFFTKISSQEIIEGVVNKTPFLFGSLFIILGGAFSLVAALQYRNLLKILKPSEIPNHVYPNMAFVLNIIIAAISLLIFLYLLNSNL